MKVGDLVKYNNFLLGSGDGIHQGGAGSIGIIIKILPFFERADNILVQWSTGVAWCVCEHWIDVVE
jgi:hypothetical protein